MMVHPSSTLNMTGPTPASSNPRQLPDVGATAQQQQVRVDRPRPKGPGSRRLPTPMLKNPAPPPTQPLPIPVPHPGQVGPTVNAMDSKLISRRSDGSPKRRSVPASDPAISHPTPPSSLVSSGTAAVSTSSNSSATVNRGIRSLPTIMPSSRRGSTVTELSPSESINHARDISADLSKIIPVTNVTPNTGSGPGSVSTRDPVITSVFTSSFSTSGTSKRASKRASTASAITAGIMAELDFNVDFNLDLNLVTLPPLKSSTAHNYLDSGSDTGSISDSDSESDEASVSSPIATSTTEMTTTMERPKTPPSSYVPIKAAPIVVPNRSNSASPSSYAFINTSVSSSSGPVEITTLPRRQSTTPSPSSSSFSSVPYKRASNGRLNGARPPPVSMSARRRTVTPTTPTSQGQFAHQQQLAPERQLAQNAQTSQEQLVQTHTVKQQHHPPVARTRTTSESAGTRPSGHAHGHGHGYSSSISSLNAMSRSMSNSTSTSPSGGLTTTPSSKPSAHKLQSLQTVMSTATLTSTRRRSALPQIPTVTPGPVVVVASTAQTAQAPVLVSVQPKQKQTEKGRESPLQTVKASSAPTTATTIGFGVNGGRASPAQSMTGVSSSFPAMTRTESGGSVNRTAQNAAVSSSGRTSPAQPRIAVPVAAVVVSTAIATPAGSSGGNGTTSAPSAFARIHPSMRTPWPVTSDAAVLAGQPVVGEPAGRVSSESSTSSSESFPGEEKGQEVEVNVAIHIEAKKNKEKAREVSPEPSQTAVAAPNVKEKARGATPDSFHASQTTVSTQNARLDEVNRLDDDSSDIVPVRMMQTKAACPPAVETGISPKVKDSDKALPALPPLVAQRKKSKWKTATSATSTLSAKAVSIANGLQSNISRKITGNLKAAIGTRSKSIPSIQDMPSELWSQIFLWCLPQPGPYSSASSPEEPLYMEPKPTSIPLILCQVNRIWRFTAISTPGLWSSLSLRLHGQPNWLYFTQSWLERAADLPLSLHISWGPDKDLEAHDDVLQYLLFKANQWKHIRLSVSKEITVWQSHGFPSRVRKLLSKTMPRLKSLEVATSLSSAISMIEVQKVAPGLRHLRLMDSAIDPLKFVSASWEQLTGFQSAYVLEVPQALTILRRCPNMVHFDVCVGSSPLVEPTKTRKIIRPVQLKVLIVRETTPYAVDGFLRSLELPGIEELYIKAETWSIYEEYGWTTDELMHLLTRSNQPKGRLGARLRKLSVFNLEWDSGDMDGFISEVPSLRTIEVKGRQSQQVRVVDK
ncbi:hypothetical protein BJ165DRAFT_1100312 [Panaeolus papilionaceus]|nr:hypothetical protein BJ165DRAFT_1100312 [Panaeolus papilionaceus]